MIWNIEKNLPSFPVADQFNTAAQCIEDVLARRILFYGVASQRKPLEMRLIFKLGTSDLRDLTSDFRFL